MCSRDTNTDSATNSYSCADARNNTRAPNADTNTGATNSNTDANPRLYPATAKYGQLVAG